MADFNLQHALHLLKSHDAVLLDTRTLAEYCKGHLAGSILVATQLPSLSKRERKNLQEQLRYTLRKVPKKKPIIVYCKKGTRAAIAKKALVNVGYHNVYVLGGIEEPPLRDVFTGKNPAWPLCYCRGKL